MHYIENQTSGVHKHQECSGQLHVYDISTVKCWGGGNRGGEWGKMGTGDRRPGIGGRGQVAREQGTEDRGSLVLGE